MDRPLLMVIVISILVLLILLMAAGWQARRRRQAGVAAPHPAPAEPGRLLGRFEGLYVATTRAGAPLERIVVHGLGFRARTVVVVTESGVLIQIRGATELYIPVADLNESRRATWTIDRVVEPGGLQLLGWRLGELDVESYFRMEQSARFEDALRPLVQEAAR